MSTTLSGSTLYGVKVTGLYAQCTSQQWAALGDRDWWFATRPANPAYVTTTSPANDTEIIAAQVAAVVITFNERMKLASPDTAFLEFVRYSFATDNIAKRSRELQSVLVCTGMKIL